MAITRESDSMGMTRRSFVQTGSIALAGMATAGRALAQGGKETLALSGGPKAVTVPAARETALTRWPRYGDAEKKALHELIDNNQFYAELPLFEKEWKEYTKSPFVKAHMNGTSALTSMYFALDLPPGSEIMVPSYTFFSTCLSMRFFGLVPIFVDVDPATTCFDLEDAKRKLTPATRALVPMHSWGLPCEMDLISDWAKEKGLIVLEDAAHSHGASMQGKMMGTWGVMSITSFQATKPMPTVEGGMGMYQTREYFERAAAFGNYDDPVKFAPDSPVRRYEGTGFGQKYRMHPFAAAVGRIQLRSLDHQNEVIAANIRQLNQHLVQLPGLSEPRCHPDQKRVYYGNNILMFDENKAGVSRDVVIKALQAEGVHATFLDYPQQHQRTIYSEAKWWHHPPTIPATMPGTDQVNHRNIFLPLFCEAADELNEQYAKAFEKVWAHRQELAKS